MNRERRKKLWHIIGLLSNLLGEEQEAFDNMPDAFYGTVKGEEMETAIDKIEESMELLADIGE